VSSLISMASICGVSDLLDAWVTHYLFVKIENFEHETVKRTCAHLALRAKIATSLSFSAFKSVNLIQCGGIGWYLNPCQHFLRVLL
jgi:hypothetical protein